MIINNSKIESESDYIKPRAKSEPDNVKLIIAFIV